MRLQLNNSIFNIVDATSCLLTFLTKNIFEYYKFFNWFLVRNKRISQPSGESGYRQSKHIIYQNNSWYRQPKSFPISVVFLVVYKHAGTFASIEDNLKI